ncbi:hypothetical protein MIT9_P0748 [Methylomarinovum caldicuralii]|uniref:Uncharacterized protein n=2 Tax=Methylomarinovum caldicuralii TaxID=438856 RepID=A0AAU9CDW6_9GAMM|nr:hypothetical protein MIT9_P0748 [Methylomarinovum caldicuralii]
MSRVSAFLLWGTMFFAGGVWCAPSCDRLAWMPERSRGVVPLSARCPQKPQLALGSILQLLPGSRLWLQSASGEEMVCQSRSDSPIALLINRTDPPWFSSARLPDCRWQERRWRCGDGRGKMLLLCVLAENRGEEKRTDTPQPATSLVLRSPPGVAGQDCRTVPQAVRRGLRLCLELTGRTDPVSLSWQTGEDGRVKEIHLPP